MSFRTFKPVPEIVTENFPRILFAFRSPSQKVTVFVMGENFEDQNLQQAFIGLLDQQNRIHLLKSESVFIGKNLGAGLSNYLRFNLEKNDFEIGAIGLNFERKPFLTQQKAHRFVDYKAKESFVDKLKTDENIGTLLSLTEMDHLHKAIVAAKKLKDSKYHSASNLCPPESSVPPTPRHTPRRFL